MYGPKPRFEFRGIARSQGGGKRAIARNTGKIFFHSVIIWVNRYCPCQRAMRNIIPTCIVLRTVKGWDRGVNGATGWIVVQCRLLLRKRNTREIPVTLFDSGPPLHVWLGNQHSSTTDERGLPVERQRSAPPSSSSRSGRSFSTGAAPAPPGRSWRGGCRSAPSPSWPRPGAARRPAASPGRGSRRWTC